MSWDATEIGRPDSQPICCPICGVRLDDMLLDRPDDEYAQVDEAPLSDPTVRSRHFRPIVFDLLRVHLLGFDQSHRNGQCELPMLSCMGV